MKNDVIVRNSGVIMIIIDYSLWILQFLETDYDYEFETNRFAVARCLLRDAGTNNIVASLCMPVLKIERVLQIENQQQN